MRATLMDWLVEVQRQFSLLLETFQLTVGIIDRYLQVIVIFFNVLGKADIYKLIIYTPYTWKGT